MKFVIGYTIELPIKVIQRASPYGDLPILVISGLFTGYLIKI